MVVGNSFAAFSLLTWTCLGKSDVRFDRNDIVEREDEKPLAQVSLWKEWVIPAAAYDFGTAHESNEYL